MKKKIYSDRLMTNMQPRLLGLLAEDAYVRAKTQEWAEEDMGNLLALCEHYGIGPGPCQFFELSLELAREFVPAFQVKAKEGRPKKWTPYRLGVLLVEFERFTNAGATNAEAAKTLAGRPPWIEIIEAWDDSLSSYGSDPAGAILEAYKKAKKDKRAKIFPHAFAYHVMSDTVEEWDAQVLKLKENY